MIAQITMQLIPTIGTVIAILSALGTAIYAWRKQTPERFGLLVDSASDVVVLQKGYIDRQEKQIQELQVALKEAQSQIKHLQEQASEVSRLRQRIDQLQDDNDLLKKQLQEEIDRCRVHERRIDELDKR